ncbi:TetR/AcrR family transcriptional regulator [Xanthobacter sp. KR7-65]|uniref:TetR/AcrR family transcriptional regulator n=1 Tax=Xanthobacter sp. KR7-65 TaxID=3156612 RepID=UPI0032B61933
MKVAVQKYHDALPPSDAANGRITHSPAVRDSRLLVGKASMPRSKKTEADKLANSATLRESSKRREENGWFVDPRVTGLVKSQVEDVLLVNQRRSQFVHTAIELFSRKGYNATTVKEIADAAKVSPGLIYQYVTDKEEILFLALQLIVHTNKEVIPAAMAPLSDPVHRFIAGFNAYCRVFDANRQACILTYRETKSLRLDHRHAIKSMEIETNELIAASVRACIEQGFFRKINIEIFVYQTIMAAHTWALKHWRLSEFVTLDSYIRDVTDNLMNTALTREGWSRYLEYIRLDTMVPG